MAVRVVIAGAMTKAFGIPAGIHKVQRHRPSAFRFNFILRCKIGTCGVRLGRCGEVKRGFNDGINPFGHANVFKSLGSGIGNHQALRVG